jgi:hypothetical protein
MAALLHKAEQLDAQEDGRYGKDKRGDELPQELQRRQERIEAIRSPEQSWKRKRPLIRLGSGNSRPKRPHNRWLRLRQASPTPRPERRPHAMPKPHANAPRRLSSWPPEL